MATIQVLEARNLKSTDPNGLSDPYCVIGAADPKTGEFVDKKTCIKSEVCPNIISKLDKIVI
jgi:hypothetical protein